MELSLSDGRRRVLVVLCALLLLGAVGVAFWARPGGGAEQAGDRAAVDALLARPAADVDGVLGDAGRIRDPVLRRLALDEWVHRHAPELDGPTGERVCQALEGATQDLCLRKVSSPHLHRSPGGAR